MRLIDTHCHAQFPAYHDTNIITSALDAHIGMIVVGTEFTTSRAAVACAQQFPDVAVYAAIGVHPSHVYEPHHDPEELVVAPSNITFDSEQFSALIDGKKVIAVGECGLDLYRIPSSISREEYLAKQVALFEQQISFAHEHDLPLIIHTRDAHPETIAVLKKMKDAGMVQRGGVIHSFTGTVDDVTAYVALGFCIGVNGIVTFPPRKQDPAAHEAFLSAIRSVPTDRLLLETDAPYLAPVPHRGEQNQPAFVEDIARAVALLRGETMETIARDTTQNAIRLFRLNN